MKRVNIHQKGKKNTGSAELGDFTVDFDTTGNIIGLEIMNAASFLREAGISTEQLSHLESAEMIIQQKNVGVTYIWLKFMFPHNIERRIPIPAPVMMQEA